MRNLGIIREFNTPNFRVIVQAEEETDLDISFDETDETQNKLESGEWVAFCAHALVIHKPTGAVLSEDFLGNCIYESYDAFMDHKECGRENARLAATGSAARCGSYFVDMVHTVCDEAREQIETLRATKTRSNKRGRA